MRRETLKKINAVTAVMKPCRSGWLLPSVICALAACVFLPRTAPAQEVRSKAAVVMDAATGRVLFAKNPDLRLMPASTTKLMTAIIVLENAGMSDVVTVTKRAAEAPATRIGLREGDRVTVEALLYAALMKSANDAAVALAESIGGTEEGFVRMMNVKAISIGAEDTRFINANGLPGEGQRITAYDLSKIMRHAIRYPALREILGTRIAEVSTENGKAVTIKNTNRLLWSDEELVGGKTGYTRQARHCFVCAGERDNETIIVALLGSPNRDLLWKESEELMSFGARVMAKTEEPVMLITKHDYESGMVKAAYTGKAKSGRTKTGVSKAKGVKTAGASAKNGSQLKKKKKKAMTASTQKKARKSYAARKTEDATKG